MRTIEALDHHFIVCAVGRMGRVVVAEMIQAGHPFVVVENNPDQSALLRDSYPEALIIEGDATREQTLRNARVEKALGLAACLAEDADNLFVCLTARSLNPGLTTVARAYNEESVDKLRRAGADHVVSPNFTGGIRMAFSLLRPHVVNFLDCVITEAGIELRLEQATLPDGSHLVGLSLAEAKIPQRTGLVVLALRREGQTGPPLYNPGPETRLQAADVMIVLGRSEQIQQLRDYADVEVKVRSRFARPRRDRPRPRRLSDAHQQRRLPRLCGAGWKRPRGECSSTAAPGGRCTGRPPHDRSRRRVRARRALGHVARPPACRRERRGKR